MMSESFVNPYNFIPLEYRKKASADGAAELSGAASGGNLLTGVVKCKLTTKTEIAIPDTERECGEGEKKRAYPFFSVGGQPTIPGSSIRGVVRSVYETLTNSCMRTSDNRLHSMSGMKSPGLLEKREDGVYLLYSAVRYRVKNPKLQNHVTGDFVFFDYKDGKGQASGIVECIGSGPCQGWFLKAHPFSTGRGTSNPSIFEKDGQSFEVDEQSIDALRENISLYVDNNESDEISVAYMKCFEAMVSGSGQLLPVWYAKDGGRYQFAPSQISRSVYSKKPSDFLRELNLEPCTDQNSCCPACSLFGFVSSGDAAASKVRFGDAKPLGNVTKRWVFLPNLMEPRTSSFEFYLRNDRDGGLKSYTPETKGTELAGRKVYWHHQKGLSREEEGWTDFNAKMELVEGGAEFGFEVYFDEINELQLNQLIYVLTLGHAWGEDADCMRLHKIGHGKPVGLGSVSIEVKNVVVRKQITDCYELSSDAGWKMPLGSVEQTFSNLSNVKTVAEFESIDANAVIDYPRTPDSEDIFAWFAANRNRFARGASQDYCVVLPRIGSQQYIPKNPATAKRSGKSGGSRNRGDAPNRASNRGRTWSQPDNRASSNASMKEEGIVVDYRADKGFGFIDHGHNKRIFFHKDKWPSGSLPREGVKVAFVRKVNESGKNKGKEFADNIQIVD